MPSLLPAPNSSYDLRNARILALIAGLSYPAWWFMKDASLPPVPPDAFWERAVVGGAFLSLFALTFLSEWVRRRTNACFQPAVWLMTLQYFSVLERARMSTGYVVGAYLMVFCVAATLREKKHFRIYAALVAVLAYWAAAGANAPPAFFATLATILVFPYIALSDRIKLVRTLAEKEARLSAIFHNAGIGILALGGNGAVMASNATASRLLGVPSESLARRDWLDFLDPRDRAAMSADLRGLFMGTLQTLRREARFQRPGADALWGRCTASLVRDARSSPAFVIVMIEDVQARHLAEEKIAEQQQMMVHASKMTALGEMAGGIAHEINNPLAIIQLCAGQLQDAIEEGASRDVLATIIRRIESTADRIAKVVKGLRSFAREGGADPFDPVPVADLVSETLEFCAERFRNHQIRLETGPMPAKARVECRVTQISQVLLNLVSNSLDAVQPLEERWVKVDAAVLGDWLEVTVTDSGKGIAPGIREKMMQPFFTTKPVGKGTGLGLSISRGIVEQHGGELGYDPSCPNTRFVIRIPLRQASRYPSPPKPDQPHRQLAA